MSTLTRVGLLFYPQCMPAGLFAFADLLHAANRRAGQKLFDPLFVAAEPGQVHCANGVSLQIAETLDTCGLDALLVPGFWAESGQQVEQMLAANQALIRRLANARRLRLWSYCTGVCLLAASGRLDGQAATVTWWLVEAMCRGFPRVHWQPERSCIIDGPVASASGVGGYQPIAQALIAEQLGAAVARDLDRLMVLPRPVQPHQAFAAMNLIEQSSPLLRRLQRLVEQLPANQVTVARLAQTLGLSARTLARRVAGETGLAIATYARSIKLNQASERLIYTSLPVSVISAELGFSSDSNLSRMFKELTALSPLEYRQRFSTTEAQ